MNDVIYWVWLALKNGYGGAEAIKLLKYFPGGAKEIFEAPREELLYARDCSPSFLRKLDDHDLREAEQILEFCFTEGIRVISCANPYYPKRLQNVYNKPLVLYVRGSIPDLNDRFCVSIIGTRDMSEYGKHMTFKLARQLIGYGAIIISGAAYGIDSSANNTAMFFETPTVAVLGSGVNVPYPASNKGMLDWIASNGMVVSEFPPNTPPNGRNFPIRNRIISGLCDALIVVEAGERSGALITARQAAEQHRRVYAVPGNVGSPNSFGTNNLIRDGAKLVTRAEDVLEDFADQFDIRQIDSIVNSDRYRRYEYNSKIPVQSVNLPMAASKQRQKTVGRAAAPQSTLTANASRRADLSNKTKNTGDTTAQTNHVPQIREESHPVEQAPQTQSKANPSADRARLFDIATEVQIRVFNAMPDGRAVTTDQIAQTGIPTDEVLSSLTMLELFSAVESLPGGLFRKLI